MITNAQRFALTTRADLVASEAEIVSERSITWAGRLAELGSYGSTGGGSSGDRRLIVEAFASLEARR